MYQNPLKYSVIISGKDNKECKYLFIHQSLIS